MDRIRWLRAQIYRLEQQIAKLQRVAALAGTTSAQRTMYKKLIVKLARPLGSYRAELSRRTMRKVPTAPPRQPSTVNYYSTYTTQPSSGQFLPSVGPQQTVSPPEPAIETDTPMLPDLEEPFYKKTWFLVGAAAVVGVAFLKRNKIKNIITTKAA